MAATLLSPRLPQALLRLGAAVRAGLYERSRSVVTFLDLRMEMLIVGWIVVVVLLGCAKVAIAPIPAQSAAMFLTMMLPYLLIALAPVAGYRIAAGSFPRGLLSAQPSMRLCRYGTWRSLNPLTAQANPSFGPTGLMASLLGGILLNVPFRSFEFILSIPAITPGAPAWAQGLLIAMTIDVAVMSFFYMICFVMALHSVPLFPRMLLFTWSCEFIMQLALARKFATMGDLPASVAASLHELLMGNTQKMMISVALWLPYLILSERVNVTYRNRVRA